MRDNYLPIFVNFSAQTSSQRTQEMIVNKLEKRRKGVIGAAKGRRAVVFVDDLNMPKMDTYGSQPPIELLRQFQDFRGFYDRDKLTWIEVEDVILLAACGPPGGGRNSITPRLVRHFSVLAIPSPSDATLKRIFGAILNVNSDFLSIHIIVKVISKTAAVSCSARDLCRIFHRVFDPLETQ